MHFEREIYISVEISPASTWRWMRRRALRIGRRFGWIKPYDGPDVFPANMPDYMAVIYNLTPDEAPFLNRELDDGA